MFCVGWLFGGRRFHFRHLVKWLWHCGWPINVFTLSHHVHVISCGSLVWVYSVHSHRKCNAMHSNVSVHNQNPYTQSFDPTNRYVRPLILSFSSNSCSNGANKFIALSQPSEYNLCDTTTGRDDHKNRTCLLLLLARKLSLAAAARNAHRVRIRRTQTKCGGETNGG